MRITRNVLLSSLSSEKLYYFLSFCKFAHLDVDSEWQAIMMVDPGLKKVSLPTFKYTS